MARYTRRCTVPLTVSFWKYGLDQVIRYFRRELLSSFELLLSLEDKPENIVGEREAFLATADLAPKTLKDHMRRQQ
jgi:hypothetical protein